MTKETLYNYIQNPHLLKQNTLVDIEHLVREYPWFQTARVLLLKNLSNISHPLFLHELPVTAVYVGDRDNLYNFIHPKQAIKQLILNAPETSDVQEMPSETSKTESLSEFIPSFDKKIEEEEPKLKSNADVSEQADVMEAIKRVEEGENANIVLPVNKDVNEETEELPVVSNNQEEQTKPKSDVLSFSDWLQQMTSVDYDPKVDITANLEKPQESESSVHNPQWDILDKFITSYETPSPHKQAPVVTVQGQDDLSTIEPESNEEFLSETLASIYVKQEDYKKAVETYKKLGLKYPEKSTYFADRIKKLKRKSKNEKQKNK